MKALRPFWPVLLTMLLLGSVLFLRLPAPTQAEKNAPSAPPPPAQDATQTPFVVTVEVTRLVTVVVTPTFTPLPPTATPLPPETTIDDDAFLGSAEAPIKVVEFSDFQCSFCARFYVTTLKPLTERYGDLIQFVYRDFPIFGEASVNAALGAECAGEQGKFWEYHGLLFSNQLQDARQPFTTETLVSYARSLDLDTEAWNTCYTDQNTYNEVVLDAITAQDWGVTGTPTFFINGKPLVGAQPLEVFVQVIDAELIALGIQPPRLETRPSPTPPR